MKQKDILFLIVVFFIGAFGWLILTVIHNKNASTISDTLATQSAPINGEFDMQTINAIKQRKIVNPLYKLQEAPLPTPTTAFVYPLPTVTSKTATTSAMP